MIQRFCPTCGGCVVRPDDDGEPCRNANCVDRVALVDYDPEQHEHLDARRPEPTDDDEAA